MIEIQVRVVSDGGSARRQPLPGLQGRAWSRRTLSSSASSSTSSWAAGSRESDPKAPNTHDAPLRRGLDVSHRPSDPRCGQAHGRLPNAADAVAFFGARGQVPHVEVQVHAAPRQALAQAASALRGRRQLLSPRAARGREIACATKRGGSDSHGRSRRRRAPSSWVLERRDGDAGAPDAVLGVASPADPSSAPAHLEGETQAQVSPPASASRERYEADRERLYD